MCRGKPTFSLYYTINLDSPISVETTRFYPITVTPPYYAMLMFNIAKFGSTPSIYGVESGDPLIKIWVSLNAEAGNSYSVVVINKHEVGTIANVNIKLPSTSKIAKSITLMNPGGLSGINGTTLGGIDFDSAKSVYKEDIVPITSQTITLSVPAARAGLVRISDSDQGLLFSDSSRVISLPGLKVDATGKYVPNECIDTPSKCKSAGEKLGPVMLSAVFLVATMSFFV